MIIHFQCRIKRVWKYIGEKPIIPEVLLAALVLRKVHDENGEMSKHIAKTIYVSQVNMYNYSRHVKR